MNKVVESILKDLENVFADMDANVLANYKKWILERRKAVRAYQDSDEYHDRSVHYSKKYEKLFDIAGGKTWYNLIDGRDTKMLMTAMEKHCANIVKRRNASIVKKLEKFEVTEVVSKNFDHTTDGFHGFYSINTDKGVKRIDIESIYAGGYNIQCLHMRTLIKVK